MTSMSKLVEYMQPWNSKFNDDHDKIHKWLAGESDTPYPGEALPVQHFFTIKASKTDLIYKDSESITHCDIRTLNWLIAPALDI